MRAVGAPACLVVASLLGLGFAAYAALHLLEPRLALTWSYAHLHRRPALPWVGAALLALGPPLATRAWRSPASAAALRPLRAHRTAAAAGLALLVVGGAGFAWPVSVVSIDPAFLLQSVHDASNVNPRWHLTLAAYAGLSRLLRPALSPTEIIRGVNAVMATVGLRALAAAARRLAATRGEAAAMALLAWSAFGTLQLALGYVDVYPVALAVTALYLWTGLGAIRGDTHPAWPLGLAALGPFAYLGLALLAPSTLVVAATCLQRPRGGRRLLAAGAVALVVAGAATVPGFGRPFAWGTFLDAAARASGAELGLSPTSSVLPAWALLSAGHAREVLHTLLLVDGIGVWLVVVAGGWALAGPWRRTWDPAAAFLAAVVVPEVAFLVVMDPLWGAFADWDLFGWGAAATSLLGGYAFVLWGRRCPARFPALLGLALAAAGVHLLARLNALHVDLKAHLVESPHHIGRDVGR
jgi:hypothetical protein